MTSAQSLDGQLVDAAGRQHHQRAAIDEAGGALVAQAGAGGAVHGHQAIGAGDAFGHVQTLAELGDQGIVAQHAVGDAVADIDRVAPARLEAEEMVEAHHAADGGVAQAPLLHQGVDGLVRDVTEVGLDGAQDLQQVLRAGRPGADQIVQGHGHGAGEISVRRFGQAHRPD